MHKCFLIGKHPVEILNAKIVELQKLNNIRHGSFRDIPRKYCEVSFQLNKGAF